HSGGRSQIVFENVPLAVAVPYEVRSRHMTPDPARWLEPEALPAKRRRRLNQLTGNHAVFEDLLLVIDVVDENVERVDSLAESALEDLPIRGLNYAGNNIKRKDAFGPGFVAVNVERDSHPQQRLLGC